MAGVDAGVIEVLRKAISGRVIEPGADGYNETRTLFNAAIDKHPAVIVRPQGADDIAAAIAFARGSGLAISVRSGGHGVTGAAIADGGLVIDMRGLNAVTVDADARVARVGGGARWADFDQATQQHALGATGGRVSTTGVAGLTLGGGSGWVERKYGLSCDSLRSATLVTAAGDIVQARAGHNDDLLWALRGGGGNFGVVTEMEFDLAPLGPEIWAGILFYRKEDAVEVARNYRDFIDAGAPDECGGGVGFLTAPPEEFVPAEIQGQVVCGVIMTWCGPPEDGPRAFAPLLGFGSPAGRVEMPLPYTMFQSMLDDPPGHRNYWSGEYLPSLPNEAIDVWAQYGLAQRPSPTQLVLFPWGGAVGRGPDAAFPARDAAWVFHPLCLWEAATDDGFWTEWARGSRAAMSRFGSGRHYLNFHSDVPQDKVADAFGPERYARLASVKATFDPDNVFHHNNNILPATPVS